jgi:hypothetical protein
VPVAGLALILGGDRFMSERHAAAGRGCGGLVGAANTPCKERLRLATACVVFSTRIDRTQGRLFHFPK